MSEHYLVRQEGRLVRVRVNVDTLTSLAAEELFQMLKSRLRYQGAMLFALDMKKVEFLDSACIGLMAGFLNDLAHVKGKMALAGCHAGVSKLLKVTRLDTVFMTYDNIDQAVSDLHQDEV